MSDHRFFDSDIHAVVIGQSREIAAARTVEDDLNFAYHLQLQEAINASLSGLQEQPIVPASADPTSPETEGFLDLVSEEVEKVRREMEDKALCEMEFNRVKTDIHRRIHDYKVAIEVDEIDDDDWEEWGDNFERPFGEGTSNGSGDNVRVYFKGSVDNRSNGVPLGGVGIAICDSRDELLFEVRKPIEVEGTSRNYIELKALLEALSVCLDLDLKNVDLYFGSYPAYRYVSKAWKPKQRKIIDLVAQVFDALQKFTSFNLVLIPGQEIKFACKLAREALVSQVMKAVAQLSDPGNPHEICDICMEDLHVEHLFLIENCMHRYCSSCVQQHVEVKLHHGMLPTCPHDDCSTAISLDSCKKLLTPKFIGIMEQLMTENSIPVTDKIYCPYPECSALMSKRSLPGSSYGPSRCQKCRRDFCLNCKVPWHVNITCAYYRSRNPLPLQADGKLKNLADQQRWRQCVKCNHMIELAEGCYHMTCRCGYQFCYTCLAEWRNGKATCSCPLWDEPNILRGA